MPLEEPLKRSPLIDAAASLRNISEPLRGSTNH
jgi:hypothetical protein